MLTTVLNGTITLRPMTYHAEVIFDYDSNNPYEVTMDVHLRSSLEKEETTPWVFGRDLLSETLASGRTSGIGQVTVFRPDFYTLGIFITSQGNTGTVRVLAREVHEWLRKTQMIVPPGSESNHIVIPNTVNEAFGL